MTSREKKIDLDLLNGFLGDALAQVGAMPDYARMQKRKAMAEIKPGDYVEGEGIFLGQCSGEFLKRILTEKADPHTLEKVFNIFAAPEDIPGSLVRHYQDTLSSLGQLKHWHGHDGEVYATDKELHTAIKDSSYKGGWVIPSSTLIYKGFFPHSGEGALAGQFKKSCWYWSSTEDRFSAGAMEVACIEAKQSSKIFPQSFALCRPVRLTEF